MPHHADQVHGEHAIYAIAASKEAAQRRSGVYMQEVLDDELHELPHEPRPLNDWVLACQNDVGETVEAVVPQCDHYVGDDVGSVQRPQLLRPCDTYRHPPLPCRLDVD